MSNLARAALLLAVFAASIPAKAAEVHPKESFTGMGVGMLSCDQYLQAVEGEKKARPLNPDPDRTYSEEYSAFVGFADGFLTGANFADATRRDVGKGTDRAGRMVWLENTCRANPTSSFANLVANLLEYLAGQTK